MKYNDNGEYKDIYVKAFDTLPVGTEVDYDGSTVPSGWTEIPDPNTYSTDEVRIGTFNGKPLYRKVIETTTTTAGTEKKTDISNLNVDKLILNGFINTSSLGLPLNAYISSSNYIITYHSKSSNEIRTTVTDSSYANKELVYILEYTKTTD